MIKSFGDHGTEDVFHGRYTKKVRTKLAKYLFELAQKKLDMINAAYRLEDLKIPPANRLESLQGDLRGFYSIRINDQWRIIFQWVGNDAEHVEIIDYHGGS
jgi:proteic killer suppression protein